MLTLIGNVQFQDKFTPARGKNEWGVDTLTRKLEGARTLLETFLATLNQGDRYLDTQYYLQSWEPDEGEPFATITLNYKGLLKGTPLPDITTEIVSAVGSISRNYSAENDGKGRQFGQELLWSLDYTGLPGGGDIPDDIIRYRPKYIQGASMDFTYRAIQTTYRYISIGQPNKPRYTTVLSSVIPKIDRVVITTSNGGKYGRIFAITLDLEPEIETEIVSFTAHNIIGTPYWECEDVIRKSLVDPESDF